MRVFVERPFILSIVLGLFISSLSYMFQPLFPFYSIAHRGASAYAPENTMAAFNQAVDLGFDYIELDVRITKDEKIVVIHDESVTRTTNGYGLVRELTVKELKKLDAGSWFDTRYKDERIPMLSEVLEKFGGKIGLIIEMKSPETNTHITEKLSHLLYSFFEKGGKPESIKVQSFQVNAIQKFHKLCPEVSAGILLSKPLDMFHLASYRSFASFISVHHQLLSKSFISQAKLFEYEIYSWTIKQQSQFLAMQKLRVHGIISDEKKKSTTSNIFVMINLFKGSQHFIKDLILDKSVFHI